MVDGWGQNLTIFNAERWSDDDGAIVTVMAPTVHHIYLNCYLYHNEVPF